MYPQVCLCGRTFPSLSAFTCHKRTCQGTKKRLAEALTAARQGWTKRIRLRVADAQDRQHEVPVTHMQTSAPEPVAVAPDPKPGNLEVLTAVSSIAPFYYRDG